MCPYIILYKNKNKTIHIWSIIFWHNHHIITRQQRKHFLLWLYHRVNQVNLSIPRFHLEFKGLETRTFICSWAWWSSSMQMLMWYVLPAEHFWLPQRHSKWTHPHAANELQQSTLKDAVLFGALLWNLHRPPTVCLTTIILVNRRQKHFKFALLNLQKRNY